LPFLWISNSTTTQSLCVLLNDWSLGSDVSSEPKLVGRKASCPVAGGPEAQFRIQKDKMLLRVEDVDEKEREYGVVSMTPRQEKQSSETAASK
jgi:hypothetical protein